MQPPASPPDDITPIVASAVSPDARVDEDPGFAPRLRVLLAEDDPLNRKVTAAMLRRRGYDVVAVADGPTAIAAAERDDIDVVLMDIQMPGMDGVTAAGHIRAAWGRGGRQAPIVAFTGNMCPEELLGGPDGFDGLLAKPFRLADLIAALERAVVDFARRAGRERAPGAAVSAVEQPGYGER